MTCMGQHGMVSSWYKIYAMLYFQLICTRRPGIPGRYYQHENQPSWDVKYLCFSDAGVPIPLLAKVTPSRLQHVLPTQPVVQVTATKICSAALTTLATYVGCVLLAQAQQKHFSVGNA